MCARDCIFLVEWKVGIVWEGMRTLVITAQLFDNFSNSWKWRFFRGEAGA